MQFKMVVFLLAVPVSLLLQAFVSPIGWDGTGETGATWS